MNMRMMEVLWRKHKIALILGAGAVAMVALLIVTAVVGATYVAVKNVSGQTNFGEHVKAAALNTSDQNLSFITEVALNLTSHTLSESLESGDLGVVVDGIACVNSIGGPHPKVVIDHLRSRTSNDLLTSRLAEIERALTSGSSGGASGRCLNWLING